MDEGVVNGMLNRDAALRNDTAGPGSPAFGFEIFRAVGESMHPRRARLCAAAHFTMTENRGRSAFIRRITSSAPDRPDRLDRLDPARPDATDATDSIALMGKASSARTVVRSCALHDDGKWSGGAWTKAS